MQWRKNKVVKRKEIKCKEGGYTMLSGVMFEILTEKGTFEL